MAIPTPRLAGAATLARFGCRAGGLMLILESDRNFDAASDTGCAAVTVRINYPTCRRRARFGPWRSPKTVHRDHRKRSMAIAENGIPITENGHPDHLIDRPLR